MDKNKLAKLQKLIESNPKNDSLTNYQVCDGLADVCNMLSKSNESTKEQKKSFVSYGEVFRKFANFHKTQLNQKEVNMEKQKTRQEIILGQKKQKAQKKKEEDDKVRAIIGEIKVLEKKYPQELVERACFRYKNANLERRNAEREMKQLEAKLEEAKRRLR